MENFQNPSATDTADYNPLLVSTLEDETDGDTSAGNLSLREAIAQARSGETITFDSALSGGTINLSQGELSIDKGLTIQGLGAENIIIDGSNNGSFGGERVFNINDSNAHIQSHVVINDLTIAGGLSDVSDPDGTDSNPATGGGVLNSENLTINNAIIRDNSADLNGGGIFSEGELTVNNSALYNNSGERTGAGGGAIASTGKATINQSTIVNNSTPARSNGGAGVFNNGGDLTVSNTTVSGNSSGISNEGGHATLTSSIVAGNSSNNDLQGDDITSGGNNLIGGESISSLDVGNVGGLGNVEASDLVGTAENPIDPLLGELQNNGGATPTQALLNGSPAIDAGSNLNNFATDQRGEGFVRTVDASTDIGAYEVQENGNGGNDLVVSTLEDENDGDLSQGNLSLREAITNAEAGSTITFDSALSGGTLELSLGELAIARDITIQGLGANNLAIDAGGKSRVFNIDDNNADIHTDVEINDLTITGGSSTSTSSNSDLGGGIFNSENLTINNASIRDNRNVGSGAGIYSDGTLRVTNSAIYNNAANGNGVSGEGGGIANIGTATINQSTIDNNSASSRSSGQLTGGGIFNRGTLGVTNSTVTDNVSGIANDNGEVTLTSTIVAKNAGNDDLQTGDFISGGNNLIGGEILSFVEGGEFVNDDPRDLIGTDENLIDPQLGELQDNGGLTPTRALLDGSPAIDGGSNPNNFATDQRGEGFVRTVGANTDIGAYEQQLYSNANSTGVDGNDSLLNGNGNEPLSLNVGENNTVDDFSIESDAIALPQGIGFDDLSLSGNEISFGDDTSLSLAGIDTTTLTASNFV